MCRSCCIWRWWKGVGRSGIPCVGWFHVLLQDNSVDFPTPQPGAGWKQIHPSLQQPVWGRGLHNMGGDADLCIAWEASPPASPLPLPSSGCLCQSSALGRDQNSSHRATEMSGWSRQSWATVVTKCPVLCHGDVAPPSVSPERALGKQWIKSAAELSPLLADQPLTWVNLGKALVLEKGLGLYLSVVGVFGGFICHLASSTA